MEGKHYSYELPFGPLIFHIAEEPHTLRIASDFPLKFKDFPFYDVFVDFGLFLPVGDEFSYCQMILEPLIGYWAWTRSSSDHFCQLTFAVLEFGRS